MFHQKNITITILSQKSLYIKFLAEKNKITGQQSVYCGYFSGKITKTHVLPGMLHPQNIIEETHIFL